MAAYDKQADEQRRRSRQLGDDLFFHSNLPLQKSEARAVVSRPVVQLSICDGRNPHHCLLLQQAACRFRLDHFGQAKNAQATTIEVPRHGLCDHRRADFTRLFRVLCQE